MAKDPSDDTGQISSPDLFTQTHWSLVQRAQDGSDTALNSLFQTYREPLLVWLRARRYTAQDASQDAEDLVQDFLAALHRRGFLSGVNRRLGKFRTFLLVSFKNHLKNAHHRQLALKRGGGQSPVSLQENDEAGQPLHDPAATDAGPDREYDRAWGRRVLANAVQLLETESDRKGCAALCAALQPVIFASESAAPYREIGDRLGMTETAVKTAAHRMRARLGELLRQQVLQTVDNEQDLQDELRYLVSLFGK